MHNIAQNPNAQNPITQNKKETNMNLIIPTPTTATKIIDAQQVTRTVWTVGDHTLTRIEREDAGKAYWTTDRLNHDAPNVGEELWLDDNAPVTYTVNWSAWGDRTPEVAFEYAERLMAAANAAQVFAAIRAEHQ